MLAQGEEETIMKPPSAAIPMSARPCVRCVYRACLFTTDNNHSGYAFDVARRRPARWLSGRDSGSRGQYLAAPNMSASDYVLHAIAPSKNAAATGNDEQELHGRRTSSNEVLVGMLHCTVS